ncbi:hypothetical protein ACFSJY_07040 [Thalassotalea euphylliae]|uniref:hypothetical protein n=1 Tax=Thalassotalea euphylliae TaxID=1655234 RepID=UPI0036326A4F
MRAYRKDLAIGINWTKEELANAGLEGGTFESFQKCAWMMYEIARERVNFPGWTVVHAGVEVEHSEYRAEFTFDGVVYPSVDEAVSHYVQIFGIRKEVFRQTLAKVGIENFAEAVMFCRIHIGATPQEIRAALRHI